MRGMLRVHEDRHLVRAGRALNLLTVDYFWAGPALRRAEHDHRPARPRPAGTRSRLGLNALNRVDGLIQGQRHHFVHRLGLIALDEQRFPTATAKVLPQLLPGDAREYGGVIDLVAVE